MHRCGKTLPGAAVASGRKNTPNQAPPRYFILRSGNNAPRQCNKKARASCCSRMSRQRPRCAKLLTHV
eukprot:11041001-Alexandrium_andersonii.AAC.1